MVLLTAVAISIIILAISLFVIAWTQPDKVARELRRLEKLEKAREALKRQYDAG